MNKNYKYHMSLLIFILFITPSCNDKKSDLHRSWESIRIAHQSSFFKKILPSNNRGEVLLDLTPENNFRYINKNEKLDLSGTYSVESGKLILEIKSEKEPLKLSYFYKNNNLVITTEDGFTFTFVKIR